MPERNLCSQGKQIHFKGQTHEKSLDNKIIKKSG